MAQKGGRDAAIHALMFQDQRHRGRPPNLTRAKWRVDSNVRWMSDRTFARYWWAVRKLARTEGEAGLSAAFDRSLWKNKTLNVSKFVREALRAEEAWIQSTPEGRAALDAWAKSERGKRALAKYGARFHVNRKASSTKK
jgi:hypothetical protein